MNELTIISYNIKVLENQIKTKKILNQLKALQCLVAVLQETHLSEAEHLQLKRDWVALVYGACYGGGRKGVLLSYFEEMFSLIVKKNIKRQRR